MLEGIPRYSKDSDTRYVTDPIVLLYASPSGNLVPLAIQLHQKPGPENPIWLPSDEPADWLTAKTWVRTADVQIHQLATNLLRAHFVMETFAMATKRNLPEMHPVYKLLIPHIRHTIAINTINRETQVLAVGGKGHMKLVSEAYSRLTIDDFFLPEALKSRGVDDVTLLPNYHYRDDAILHWDAIGDYVSKIVDLYYLSDDDVINDLELQRWIADVRENGLVKWSDDVDHGVVEKFTSAAELKRWSCMIIFTATVGHAMTNFSQMDIYGFIPISPLAMHNPPPTKKGEATMDTLMDSLPEGSAASAWLALTYGLSRYSPEEVY